MIYTVTLNPSVDYIVELDQVLLGGLNRTTNESKFPGGKGINVSQVLKRFGEDSTALGFIGGFTGIYIKRFLESLTINTDFIHVSEDTRINVKIKSKDETEINAKGPRIEKADFDALKEKIETLKSEDTLVLAGSIPSGMPQTTYEELVRICSSNGGNFVVDAEGELLVNVLPFHPWLIKPNHHELGEIFHTEITSVEDVIPYARELINKGAQNVIVSLGGDGAVFVNKETVLFAPGLKGEVKSTVGSGDSMVAGFIAAFKQTNSIEKAFRYSVAAGSATAFSFGLCERDAVERLLADVKIESLM